MRQYIKYECFSNKKANTLKKFADSINETYNYKYIIDYSYDDYKACEHGSDCCNNDYCRCGLIQNIKLKNIPYDKIINKISKISIIDQYCIDRILSFCGFNNIDNYEPIVSGGYYGEELDAIILNESIKDNIYKHLYNLIPLSDFDKIKYILDMEYDIPATSLKDLSNVSVQTISTYDIIFPLGLRKLKQNYKDYNLPRAISTRYKDHTYSIIDGYSRINSAIQNDIKEIQVILLS